VRSSIFSLSVAVLLLAPRAPRAGAAEFPPTVAEASNVLGGLVVIVDGGEPEPAASLARTGRYLVHLLERDAAVVDSLRARLQATGLYGLASVEQLEGTGKLPYAEDLVNLLVIADPTAGGLTLAEAARVVCPGGTVLAVAPAFTREAMKAAGLAEVREIVADGRLVIGRKPRPEAIDEWSHPRHGADGNAVSLDRAVGPSRRIRWVAGPQVEISNLVSAGGRNFYAGVLARDAFNGLKLWEKTLDPSPARGGFGSRAAPGSVLPVASADRLMVFDGGKLRALDAASGAVQLEYAAPRPPLEILHLDGVLLSVDQESINAFESGSGKLRWSVPAARPRCVVAGDGSVFYLEGPTDGSAGARIASVTLAAGKILWENHGLDWLARVRRCVHHRGYLACEISTLSDEARGNELRMLSAADGRPLWAHPFTPFMAHFKQARAMFVDDTVWVIAGNDESNGSGGCLGLDPLTGAVKRKLPGDFGHCFPPVATSRYLFTGEMDPVDLATGEVQANRITKGACSRDAGVVLANGLIYASPKHCRCWPMLRDYSALAPQRPGGELPPVERIEFRPEAGPAAAPAPETPLEDPAVEWTCYRHDAFRSGATLAPAPVDLRVLWTASLGAWPEGRIADEWRGNYFIRGPVGPPVVAGGLVFVTRPDAHQVVAIDARSGKVRWSFTASGRVDTAPTIHRGLCLFGSKSGHVYCLRADDGRLVWRLRAAPVDERIVAYGQIESPWPIPGSVLVVDDAAYFACGRQSLADGGILVFSVDPRTGKPRWVRRLDSVPQKEFYASSGQDFDNFDLLHREGDGVAMSRWLFDRDAGKMTCLEKSGFAQMVYGQGSVMFPRGTWSYAPVDEPESWKERPFVRPLMVFRDRTLFGSSQERDVVFRRDFDLESGEKFNSDWFSGWETAHKKLGVRWRSERLAKSAQWSVAPFAPDAKAPPSGNAKAPRISAMALTAGALFVVGEDGRLAALSPKDGKTLGEVVVPPPAWDGLAVAEGCLFLTTQDGRVVACGAR
jgi:outer membrane protein assembly factor BamB